MKVDEITQVVCVGLKMETGSWGWAETERKKPEGWEKARGWEATAVKGYFKKERTEKCTLNVAISDLVTAVSGQ